MDAWVLMMAGTWARRRCLRIVRLCVMVIADLEAGESSRCQLDEMLVPNPSNLVVKVVLILRKPELALLADDIKDLHTFR